MCYFPKDEDLWEKVASTVRKNTKREKLVLQGKVKRGRGVNVSAEEKKEEVLNLIKKPVVRGRAAAAFLVKGDAAALDKATGARFIRGKIAPEARLDLHGKTLDKAAREVSEFVRLAYESGIRCVLIITGKGAPDIEGAGRLYTGKLRAELIEWLNMPEVRPFVLSFTEAAVKDGGAGAFYVYIKRKR